MTEEDRPDRSAGKNSRIEEASKSKDDKANALQERDSLHPDSRGYGQQGIEQEEAKTHPEWSRENEVSGKEKPAGEAATETAGDEPTEDKSAQPAGFPVVGIGASAGGLEALEQFVSALPENSGIAFVVVTHTHPEHPTRMPELLRRKSSVQVVLIEDGMELAPDTIYIPPSDLDPVMSSGVLRLRERTAQAEIHMPIDMFFRSLAEEKQTAAGGVILSGTGTDGTGGVRRIKEKAGVAAAQTRESARHAGMPASAIETDMVDYVLAPSEIAAQLIAYFKHPVAIRADAAQKQRPPEGLNRVLSFLADQTAHDFSLYKKSTLTRRIERRMTVTRSTDIEAYMKILHRSPEEVRALFQDLLIGVTNFFRDPEAFERLRDKVLPELFSQSRENDTFRVWVPGCATGEEAYSAAIIILEELEKLGSSRRLQIFATDVNKIAIEKARAGLYPENIATDVSAERLKRFFIKEGSYYRIKKEIRESVVFAEQNVLRDPPFMHLDILICRNLLIYLEPKAQEKLIPLFHYNLKAGGVLFLGTSESPGRFANLFYPVAKKLSIYKKRDTQSPLQQQIQFPSGGMRTPRPKPESGQPAPVRQTPNLGSIIEKNLLDHHTPPCVLVDSLGDIVYIHGRTGKYLEHAGGRPSLHITEQARQGLRHAISAALRRAADNREEARETGLRMQSNGDTLRVNLRIKPLDEALKDHFMILFEELPESSSGEKTSEAFPASAPEGTDETYARRIAELERELENLREDYHSAREELETSNEELKSSNEELKSSNEEMYSANEELQSSNEELDSSREELESLNEELSTVNAELNDKIAELEQAYGKVTNVLNSTGIAIVFLGNELRIHRFTEAASRLINLIDKDVGRPIDHISHNLEFTDLNGTVRRVLKDLVPFEGEVRTRDGHWYRMRIMAHRSPSNIIEGVVITFINVDLQKTAQQELEQYTEQAVSAARQYAQSIVDTVRESLLVLDKDRRVITGNQRFYEAFHTSAEKTEGRFLFELEDGQWDIADLRGLLDEIAAKDQAIENYRVEHHFKSVGFKRLHLNARRLRGPKKGEERILLAIEDVTDTQ